MLPNKEQSDLFQKPNGCDLSLVLLKDFGCLPFKTDWADFTAHSAAVYLLFILL